MPRRCAIGCGRRPSSWHRARSRPPLRMCSFSLNASPCSIASSLTRTGSLTVWCGNSLRPPPRPTRTRRRRASQCRREICPTQPSCCRCPASVPECSPRFSPKAATRYGGGTTTHFGACAGWLRSPGTGKSLLVTQRRAAQVRLRDAVFHWSRVAVQRDPVSHGKYQALRARGHGHARALRSVADRLLGVACAMLRDRHLFRPAPGRRHHRVSRGSPGTAPGRAGEPGSVASPRQRSGGPTPHPVGSRSRTSLPAGLERASPHARARRSANAP